MRLGTLILGRNSSLKLTAALHSLRSSRNVLLSCIAAFDASLRSGFLTASITRLRLDVLWFSQSFMSVAIHRSGNGGLDWSLDADTRHRLSLRGVCAEQGAGVFGVRAQIPRACGSPFGCCASLRSEIAI